MHNAIVVNAWYLSDVDKCDLYMSELKEALDVYKVGVIFIVW
jgi:hypothetical protein